MKKLILSLAIIAGLSACNKDGGKTPTPVKTFTATLDIRPSNNDNNNIPVTVNRTKNVFLSFNKGRVYNIDEAKLNAADIDLVIYDGETIGTAIGSVRIISPGGGILSLSGGSGQYAYLKPGTINESVRYYNLLEMSDWSRYNQSAFSVPLNGNIGISEADFNKISNVDELATALSNFKTQNPDAQQSEKPVFHTSTGQIRSKFFRATYEKDGGTAEAFIMIKDLRYLPNGYMTIEVKTVP